MIATLLSFARSGMSALSRLMTFSACSDPERSSAGQGIAISGRRRIDNANRDPIVGRRVRGASDPLPGSRLKSIGIARLCPQGRLSLGLAREVGAGVEVESRDVGLNIEPL